MDIKLRSIGMHIMSQVLYLISKVSHYIFKSKTLETHQIQASVPHVSAASNEELLTSKQFKSEQSKPSSNEITRATQKSQTHRYYLRKRLTMTINESKLYESSVLKNCHIEQHVPKSVAIKLQKSNSIEDGDKVLSIYRDMLPFQTNQDANSFLTKTFHLLLGYRG